MKTEWNYSELAEAYLRRPGYSSEALRQVFSRVQLIESSKACDVGAGVGHLTLELASTGSAVTAVEPNDEMRGRGILRTQHLSNVTWIEGTAEATHLPSGAFDLVSFGSSFNVVDRAAALAECRRLLRPGGWFCCLWNHRDLSDPIQAAVERVIHNAIDNYDYGTRRENQTSFLQSSGYFDSIEEISGDVRHEVSRSEALDAWRSHATLHRQAGSAFPAIIAAIESELEKFDERVVVPYTTRIWLGKMKA